MECKIITDINDKLSTNKLTITEEDKWKTIVLLTEEEYKLKVNNFTQYHKFIANNNNATQQYHTQ
jgi:hypothetical protein